MNKSLAKIAMQIQLKHGDRAKTAKALRSLHKRLTGPRRNYCKALIIEWEATC